jgi:hypothetical protein
MSSPKIFQTALAVAGASLIVGAAACNLAGNKSSVGQSNIILPQARPTRDPNAVKYFESVEEINKLKAAFTEKIGGEVKILEMSVAENYAQMQVQDPQKLENVDLRDDVAAARCRSLDVRASSRRPARLEHR